VAQTWTMLQIIYSNPNIVPATNLNHSLGKSSSNIPLMNSFNLKDIPSRIGTESWLERTKGENRPKAILMDSSSTLINNDAEEQEYILPQEAFPLRHEIVDNPSALNHLQDKADSPHVSGNEQGDVQMAVSILIVLGDCIKKGIDDQTQVPIFTGAGSVPACVPCATMWSRASLRGAKVGHLQHIMKWLETSSHCPTGCGHVCKYT
ncbi:hypothetical protein Chor_008876, partial [Crotalus horridus]